MLKWLKKKIWGDQFDWERVQQSPGTIFPLLKGSKLRPEEDVIFSLPASALSQPVTIKSVLKSDKSAELAWDKKTGTWQLNLKAGVAVSLIKSCQAMLVAQDRRPRFFGYLPPKTMFKKRNDLLCPTK